MKENTIFTKIYYGLEKIESKFYSILEKLVAVMMFIVTLDVVYQVAYRTILVKFITIPSIFTEEFARYGIIWIMFLFLPICIKEGRFAAVTLVIEKSNPKIRKLIFFINQSLSLAFIIIAFRYSFIFVQSNLLFTSPSMRLPGIYIYSCIPIGLGLCIIQLLIEFLGVISGGLAPFTSLLSSEGKGGAD